MGSILGSPYFGNLPCRALEIQTLNPKPTIVPRLSVRQPWVGFRVQSLGSSLVCKVEMKGYRHTKHASALPHLPYLKCAFQFLRLGIPQSHFP